MTQTVSHTFTATDTKKVLSSFEADATMLARANGCATDEKVRDTAHDITLFALLGYLVKIEVALENAQGSVIRFRTYTASLDATTWNDEDPGNNRWPATPGGKLVFHVYNNDAWNNMSLDARIALQGREGFKTIWRPTSVLSNGHLTPSTSRQYSSNAYGLARKDFQ
jgi:hypothetical protein